MCLVSKTGIERDLGKRAHLAPESLGGPINAKATNEFGDGATCESSKYARQVAAMNTRLLCELSNARRIAIFFSKTLIST